MTTLREIGEYLIEVADNGRVLQIDCSGDWIEALRPEMYTPNIQFDLSCEYRLKPKVTYYRVYIDEDELLDVCSSDKPIPEWSGDNEIIKDFEVSE